jgi:hypothetical protein
MQKFSPASQAAMDLLNWTLYEPWQCIPGDLSPVNAPSSGNRGLAWVDQRISNVSSLLLTSIQRC